MKLSVGKDLGKKLQKIYSHRGRFATISDAEGIRETPRSPVVCWHPENSPRRVLDKYEETYVKLCRDAKAIMLLPGSRATVSKNQVQAELLLSRRSAEEMTVATRRGMDYV